MGSAFWEQDDQDWKKDNVLAQTVIRIHCEPIVPCWVCGAIISKAGVGQSVNRILITQT
jgi:hypothetical protein